MLPSSNLTENSIWITDQQVVGVEANAKVPSNFRKWKRGRKQATEHSFKMVISMGILISIV